MERVDSETTKVGKANIHYLVGGHGEPLIVIHGAGGGSRAWLQNARELSKYFTIYVPDLPGFGRSQLTSDNIGLSDLVAFVDDFTRSLGLKRFYLIGHSIGGYVAMKYALQFPKKVKKLVLVSSIGLGKEIAFWVRVGCTRFFRKHLGGPVITIQRAIRWLVRLLDNSFEFSNPVSQVKINLGRSIVNLKGQTKILLSQLSELLVPTLLIWGDGDRVVPMNQAYAAAQLIPNCQVQVFEDCGHSVYKERVREFSELLARFLD